MLSSIIEQSDFHNSHIFCFLSILFYTDIIFHHDYLDYTGLRKLDGGWFQFLFLITNDVIMRSMLLLKNVFVLANFLIL